MGIALLLSAICLGCPLIFMPSYISEGMPFPRPLTSEEEARYIRMLKQEETHSEAKEKLISHNMRLIAHVAKKYSSTGISQDDLISIGTIGLIKAVDSYSPEKNVRLGTYAARCIENAIPARTRKKIPQDNAPREYWNIYISV